MTSQEVARWKKGVLWLGVLAGMLAASGVAWSIPTLDTEKQLTFEAKGRQQFRFAECRYDDTIDRHHYKITIEPKGFSWQVGWDHDAEIGANAGIYERAKFILKVTFRNRIQEALGAPLSRQNMYSPNRTEYKEIKWENLRRPFSVSFTTFSSTIYDIELDSSIQPNDQGPTVRMYMEYKGKSRYNY